MDGKRYVVDGNWAVCTDGQIQQGIVVNSQNTIFASKQNKLVATLPDRMIMNFNCAKLINAAAIVGTIVGAAAGAFMGMKLGLAMGSVFGPIGAVVGGVVGAIAGAVVGGLTGSAVASKVARKAINTFVPCFCAILTKASPWSSVHERVLLTTHPALMPDATVPCMLGGLVSLAIPDMEKAIQMANASMFIYCDKDENNDSQFDNYGGQTFEDFEKYNPEQFGWKEMDPNSDMIKNIAANSRVKYKEYIMVDSMGNKHVHHYFYDKQTGTKTGIYQTPQGETVLVSRGTHNSEEISSGRDWVDDNAKQGILGESDQYDQDARIAEYTREEIGNDAKLITTGHSMAGGKSALAGATGKSDDTYAFNAAGVHHNMFAKHDKSATDAAHVYSFSSNYDQLTLANDNLSIAPNTAGKRIVLNIEATPINSLADIKKWFENGHDLPYLIAEMEKIPRVNLFALDD
ncbi:MAG: hypothetical protein RL662_1066 [Bacteroidota bacterium]|jgi:uncharacterized membrane protein